MITTNHTQETSVTDNSSKLRKLTAAGSLGLVLLGGCASHDTSSAAVAKNPSAPTTSAKANEAQLKCDVTTDGGDFTVRARYPKSDSAKAPEITLTSEKQFALGDMTDFDMAGDWVTAFADQPQSNNVAIRKDGQFEMSFYNGNADLSDHAGRLLLQGHGNAAVTCEVAD